MLSGYGEALLSRREAWTFPMQAPVGTAIPTGATSSGTSTASTWTADVAVDGGPPGRRARHCPDPRRYPGAGSCALPGAAPSPVPNGLATAAFVHRDRGCGPRGAHRAVLAGRSRSASWRSCSAWSASSPRRRQRSRPAAGTGRGDPRPARDGARRDRSDPGADPTYATRSATRPRQLEARPPSSTSRTVAWTARRCRWPARSRTNGRPSHTVVIDSRCGRPAARHPSPPGRSPCRPGSPMSAEQFTAVGEVGAGNTEVVCVVNISVG